MQISVSFYGNLMIYRSDSDELKENIHVNDGLSIADFIIEAGIRQKNIKAVLNGAAADSGSRLSEGDYLQLYSLHSGG